MKQKRQRMQVPGWFKTALLAASVALFAPWGASAHSGSKCGCPAGPDHTPPIAKCKTGTVDFDVSCTPAYIPVSLINNGSCDNAGGSGIDWSMTKVTTNAGPYTCAEDGQIKWVTLKVVDNAGNYSTCSTKVEIECYQPTCSLYAVGANPTPTGCSSAVSGSGSTTNPYVITLGYGAQCLKIHGSASGANIYYNYCFSVSTSTSGVSTTGLLTAPPSCTAVGIPNCQDRVFCPTQPGIYTVKMVTQGFPGPTEADPCTPVSPCSATCTITICVTDVQHDDDDDDDDNHCHYDADEDYDHGWNNYWSNDHDNDKKVYLCHVPPGNPSNAHTIYISKNAVSAHLKNHPGDHIGMCNQQCGEPKKKKGHHHNSCRTAPGGTMYTSGVMEILLYPNPSTKDFHITIESDPAVAPAADVIIYDLTGRVVEKHLNQATNGEVSVGQQLAPGAYIIQVKHGDESKMIRVTKQ